MARVLGIHRLELKPGVDEQVFEQFIKETFAPMYHQFEPRQVAHLMKADRGEQAGKYALLIEIESVAARDQMYPAEGGLSETLDQAVKSTAPIWEKLYSFVEKFPDTLYSDYVVLT